MFECECECGCACYCECARECECECLSGMFQMRWVARRFTPVCRRRRGAGGVPAPGGSYGVWDQSPCVWFCLCRRIETTLPTVVWDQQRSVNVHSCVNVNVNVEVDVAPAGGARPRRREVRTGFGTIPLVCGFSCAGQ